MSFLTQLYAGVARPMQSRARGGAAGLASSLDLSDPRSLADPFSAYETLRKTGSVHYLPRQNFWIVLDYDDLKAAFADTRHLSNRNYERAGPVLIAADPPKHIELRRLVAPYFSQGSINRSSEMIREFAPRLVRPQFDVVAQYARPLAERAAAEMLGFPPAALLSLSRAAAHYHCDRRRFDEFTAFLDEIADRSDAFADLLSRGEGLLDGTEARQLIRFLWLAATVTTERTIAQCVLTLMRQPELKQAVMQDFRWFGPFVNEVLRLYPPELMVPRATTSNVVLGGVSIPSGRTVMLCLAAGNRDPSKFPAPAVADIYRSRSQHLAFGTGIHRCSGTVLANTIIPIAIEALVQTAPALRLAESPRSIAYYSTIATFTPQRLLTTC